MRRLEKGKTGTVRGAAPALRGTAQGQRQQARTVGRDIRQQSKTSKAFVDKFGRRYSSAILTAWSPRALEALGIRPATELEADHAR